MSERDKSAPGSHERPRSLQDGVSIAATREDVVIDVEKQETGAVRVHKVAHEELVDIPLILRSEQVHVHRVEVNRPVDSEYGPRQEGDTLIIPVFEYVPVTEMRLMLKEEVHVTKQRTEREVIQSVPVKKNEVVIEKRDGSEGEWIKQE